LLLVTLLLSAFSVTADDFSTHPDTWTSTTACAITCPNNEVPDALNCTCSHGNNTLNTTVIPMCPQINCSDLSNPCLAFKKDIQGCPSCECIHLCPKPVCPKQCPMGTENFDDEFGCPSCRCKQPPRCKKIMCQLFCPAGYEKDKKTGCNICLCKQCADPCKKECRYGKLVDFYGCFLCECRPKPTCGTECPPLCRNACPFGRVFDGNGCPTCQCLPNPDCKPVCDNFCEFGRVPDEKACPTCVCLPKP